MIPSRLTVEVAHVSRQRLAVDTSKNARRYMGNLAAMGASLDKEGQTDPLVVVELPGAEPGIGDLAVRDGFRRTGAIDGGHCPRFAAADRIWVHILRTSDGGVPTDIEVHRYCATRNNVRLNWSEIEQATYFKLEIEHTLRFHATSQGELTSRDEATLRARTIEQLGVVFDLHPRTVRMYLQLLTLPRRIQTDIIEKRISVAVARRMIRAKANPSDMARLVDQAAKVSSNGNGHRVARPSPPGKGGGGATGGPGRHGAGGNGTKSTGRVRTHETGRWPRVREREMSAVLEREGLAKPKAPVRSAQWFTDQISRVREMIKGLSDDAPQEKEALLRAVLQVLRCASGEIEKMPV